MAEGDTIVRAAQRIEAAIGGQQLSVGAPNPRGRAAGVERLDGSVLEGIETHGKHLLFDFGELSLHSHLGMSGGWHVYRRGNAWRRLGNSLVFEATTKRSLANYWRLSIRGHRVRWPAG